MFDEWNARLAAAKEQGRNQAKWQSRLERLKRELSELEHKALMWREQLGEEEQDVARLTGMSLSNLFYTLLGRKTEKLEREQLEVLEAKVKYDEAAGAAEDAKAQIEELERKLQEVRFWNIEYETVLREKEKLLLPGSQELAELADRQAELTVQVKELTEAIHAGQSVEASLGRAEETLRSARNWGTYDMLGGGMISTHMKHSRIDEAMEHIRLAQRSLSRFEAELKDVRIAFSIDLEISGFLRFADFFFDGLIADWTVQGKINDTYRQVQEKIELIAGVMNELETARSEAEGQLAGAKRRYTSLLENAQ